MFLTWTIVADAEGIEMMIEWDKRKQVRIRSGKSNAPKQIPVMSEIFTDRGAATGDALSYSIF